MSSHSGPGDPTPIRSKSQLAGYLARGARPRSTWSVGSEYEKIPVHAVTGARLPYQPNDDGPGILALLEKMSGCCGWKPAYDGTHMVALRGVASSVTLEPGGQFELSGVPLSTIHEMDEELQAHELELAHLEGELPVKWLWVGADPVHTLAETWWMPKRRYAIMRRYLPTRGTLAHHMMLSTCTVQANLDFADEVDMGHKLRTSMGLSSLVTAMFANSPLQRGRPSGFKSFRAHVWSHVDADRQGLLRWVFEGDPPGYGAWAEYALRTPMFFIVREDAYIDCAGLPFGQFLEKGFAGHEATMADWELHLTTLFPDVRLKTYLEMRSADCVKPALAPAVPALWKGLLYDEDARAAAWDLVRRWTFDERQAHREAVARDALAAPVPGTGYATAELARELVTIARYGLGRQATAAGHADESPYLAPLADLVAEGRCPADLSLAWYARTNPKPADILRHYQAD